MKWTPRVGINYWIKKDWKKIKVWTKWRVWVYMCFKVSWDLWVELLNREVHSTLLGLEERCGWTPLENRRARPRESLEDTCRSVFLHPFHEATWLGLFHFKSLQTLRSHPSQEAKFCFFSNFMWNQPERIKMYQAWRDREQEIFRSSFVWMFMTVYQLRRMKTMLFKYRFQNVDEKVTSFSHKQVSWGCSGELEKSIHCWGSHDIVRFCWLLFGFSWILLLVSY